MNLRTYISKFFRELPYKYNSMQWDKFWFVFWFVFTVSAISASLLYGYFYGLKSLDREWEGLKGQCRGSVEIDRRVEAPTGFVLFCNPSSN